MEHNQLDKQYNRVAENVLYNGHKKDDRTGVGTISYFDDTIRFNMLKDDEFPMLTGKKVPFKTMMHELLWFLEAYDDKYIDFGNTNIKYLVDHNCNIWNEWPFQKYISSMNPHIANWKYSKPWHEELKKFVERIKTDDEFAEKHGKLGPVYGQQWRGWRFAEFHDNGSFKGSRGYIDQIENAIIQLKDYPDSRRIMVNAWNVADIPEMELPPCHYGFQFWTRELDLKERIMIAGRKIGKSKHYFEDFDHKKLDKFVGRRAISLKFTMRSIDVGLGLPFNLASYGALLHMIGHIVNMEPEDLIWSGADVHIYSNHVDQIKEQLRRDPKPLPSFRIKRKIDNIEDFRIDDFELINYDPHPHIKMDVAV
jgi:thymidylate synthase